MGRLNTANGSRVIPDRRSVLDKVPTVYFDVVTIPGYDEAPRIKVGESGNHHKRRGDHGKQKFGVTFKVEPLCVVRGGRADEQQILKYFAPHLLENEEETFWPHDDLLDYIRWLRDQYFVWVPDDPNCQPVEQLDLVESGAWMPTPERRKAKPNSADLFAECGMFGQLGLPPREVTGDDFYTSEVILESARGALGAIDLDPASHAVANFKVRATAFFSARDNGLTKDWFGRVWLNPPFSQWQAWVPKIVHEWRSGRVTAMCVLCATRTLTAQYFSAIHEGCSALCILRGRIPFWGDRAASPDDGHAVFYFGTDVTAFEREFGAIGNTYRPSR